MKRIRYTPHALEQCRERGATEEEVTEAIRNGKREPAKKNRILCGANFQYNSLWGERFYSIKQVAAVTAENENEIVVVTVYTFYY